MNCYEEILEVFSSGTEISDDLRQIIESETSMPNISFPTMVGLSSGEILRSSMAGNFSRICLLSTQESSTAMMFDSLGDSR